MTEAEYQKALKCIDKLMDIDVCTIAHVAEHQAELEAFIQAVLHYEKHND